MKAVIVEIKDGYAAVLTQDGGVSRIKNKNYAVGQEISINQNKKYARWAATATASLAVLIGAPAWAYMTPYSYVSIDVNPSVELTINRFNRVLEVNAVNDDGEKIVEQISLESLKHRDVSEAVENVLEELKDEGYIVDGEEGGVVVAASSKTQEKTDELKEKVKGVVEKEIKVKKSGDEKSNEDEDVESEEHEDSEDSEEGIEVEIIGVGQEKVEEAKVRGVTPGKMNLVIKLQESAEDPDDINVDEWLEKPVKDIMKATKENKKQAKQEQKSNQEAPQGNGQNKGQETGKPNN
jgi:ribosomal protein S8